MLQRIWVDRAFSVAGARTEDDRRVKIDKPWRWNRLGGPDFRQARVEIGGEWYYGDVELHLREEDWRLHAHADDPNYD
ncbi:MAG: DUF2851 family protein [Candidatus Synoicihabitans palmerolidicus]|nr:DUF2851 family protein [Candidatus Synoicihabitans palmerolidicus]